VEAGLEASIQEQQKEKDPQTRHSSCATSSSKDPSSGIMGPNNKCVEELVKNAEVELDVTDNYGRALELIARDPPPLSTSPAVLHGAIQKSISSTWMTLVSDNNFISSFLCFPCRKGGLLCHTLWGISGYSSSSSRDYFCW